MVSKTSRMQGKLAIRLLLVLLVGALSACASNPPLERPGGGEGQAGAEYGQPGMDGSGIDVSKLDQRGLQGVPKNDRRKFVDQDSLLSVRTIYFAFDSSVISPEFRDVIQAHADYLASHPRVDLRLEGHTDERGTREYNVALGERRAESVEQALIIAGASRDQLTTLSFGEEMPAVLGHTDEAYAKNRRVELIYVDK